MNFQHPPQQYPFPPHSQPPNGFFPPQQGILPPGQYAPHLVQDYRGPFPAPPPPPLAVYPSGPHYAGPPPQQHFAQHFPPPQHSPGPPVPPFVDMPRYDARGYDDRRPPYERPPYDRREYEERRMPPQYRQPPPPMQHHSHDAYRSGLQAQPPPSPARYRPDSHAPPSRSVAPPHDRRYDGQRASSDQYHSKRRDDDRAPVKRQRIDDRSPSPRSKRRTRETSLDSEPPSYRRGGERSRTPSPPRRRSRLRSPRGRSRSRSRDRSRSRSRSTDRGQSRYFESRRRSRTWSRSPPPRSRRRRSPTPEFVPMKVKRSKPVTANATAPAPTSSRERGSARGHEQSTVRKFFPSDEVSDEESRNASLAIDHPFLSPSRHSTARSNPKPASRYAKTDEPIDVDTPPPPARSRVRDDRPGPRDPSHPSGTQPTRQGHAPSPQGTYPDQSGVSHYRQSPTSHATAPYPLPPSQSAYAYPPGASGEYTSRQDGYGPQYGPPHSPYRHAMGQAPEAPHYEPLSASQSGPPSMGPPPLPSPRHTSRSNHSHPSQQQALPMPSPGANLPVRPAAGHLISDHKRAPMTEAPARSPLTARGFSAGDASDRDAQARAIDESELPTYPSEAPSPTDATATATTNKTSEYYERIEQVGEGTYGKVYKAKSIEDGTLVALKMIRMDAEKDGFPVTAVREIKLLQSLRHENVVLLKEMMVSRGHVHMVFQYVDHDLTGVLRHPKIKFSPAHLKSMMAQLLCGLEYIHRRGVLHRDLKGSNILVSRSGQLKIADFGLARFFAQDARNDYTNRVITQWYKPPELLFGATVYGPEVDVWSAGCIFLELFSGRPAFQGNDEIHQLDVIFRIMGTPDSTTWPDVIELPWYELVKPKKVQPNRLRDAYAKYMTTPATFDCAEILLTLNPERRVTARDALALPYFVSEDPQPEPPAFLEGIEGDWHELEAKRRTKRKSMPTAPDEAAE